MTQTLFDRLALHAATFDKIAEKNMASHYQEVCERGQRAHLLAMDIKKAMIAVRELDELREIAKDTRVSSELIGIRIRNSVAYT